MRLNNGTNNECLESKTIYSIQILITTVHTRRYPQHKLNIIELCVRIFHQLKLSWENIFFILLDILCFHLKATKQHKEKNFSHVPNLVNDAKLNEKKIQH